MNPSTAPIVNATAMKRATQRHELEHRRNVSVVSASDFFLLNMLLLNLLSVTSDMVALVSVADFAQELHVALGVASALTNRNDVIVL